MNTDEVTAQILEAWDEVKAEPEGAVAEEEATEEPDAEAEEGETEEPEAKDEEDAEDAEEEEGEEEVEVAAEAEEPAYDDVEIQAFLSKYGGDVEKALKGAAELQRLMGRQGQEKSELGKRVELLESQLSQARALGGGGFLSEEQREWVEGAAESANPGGYVQQALQAGEYDLARAVCREWAQSNPFEAMRAGQVVDAVEYQAQEAQSQPEPVPPATTWRALAESYPELRTYEEQMVTTLTRLGPDHPLVQEARSDDPSQAVRGIFGIYEIAKASTFALSETRKGLKQKRSQEADDAIDAAVVTSATNTPSAGKTPRNRMLMPGLTEEQFEAEFAVE